jgi:hypothetical protein
METAREDGMRMRSTVVGKTWARILLALAAGAITGLLSLDRAQSRALRPPADSQEVNEVTLAGSR